jgi:hypothetical protein
LDRGFGINAPWRFVRQIRRFPDDIMPRPHQGSYPAIRQILSIVAEISQPNSSQPVKKGALNS